MEYSASAWFDDHTGAPVEAKKLREFAVALFKSKTVLPRDAAAELFQRLSCISGNEISCSPTSVILILLQGLLENPPSFQIGVGAQRFRQARDEILNNRAVVSNLIEWRRENPNEPPSQTIEPGPEIC